MKKMQENQKKGLSLKFFKNAWVLAGIFSVILVVVVVTILTALTRNGNDIKKALAADMNFRVDIKMADNIISIPDSYVYKFEKDGSITLTDDTSSWSANISYKSDVPYENFVSNFNKVVDSYKAISDEIDVVDSGVLEVGEKGYLYIDIVGTTGVLTGSYIYTGMDNHILEIIIETAEAEFKHDLLEKLAPIIENIRPITNIEGDYSYIIENRLRLDLPAITAQGS